VITLPPADPVDILEELDLSLESNEWQVVCTSSPRDVAAELMETMQVLGRPAERLDCDAGPHTLLDGHLPEGAVAVICGIENWTDDALEQVDFFRERLITTIHRAIIVTTDEGAFRLRRRAPHLSDLFQSDIGRWKSATLHSAIRILDSSSCGHAGARAMTK
jgi:hypothetical protein